MGHPINVPIRRTMHLSSVIPANDTGESALGLRNFPHRERGSNLGPEASALITELPRSYPSSLLAAIKTDHYALLVLTLNSLYCATKIKEGLYGKHVPIPVLVESPGRIMVRTGLFWVLVVRSYWLKKTQIKTIKCST